MQPDVACCNFAFLEEGSSTGKGDDARFEYKLAVLKPEPEDAVSIGKPLPEACSLAGRKSEADAEGSCDGKWSFFGTGLGGGGNFFSSR